jgi:hypothetical protein
MPETGCCRGARVFMHFITDAFARDPALNAGAGP